MFYRSVIHADAAETLRDLLHQAIKQDRCFYGNLSMRILRKLYQLHGTGIKTTQTVITDNGQFYIQP